MGRGLYFIWQNSFVNVNDDSIAAFICCVHCVSYPELHWRCCGYLERLWWHLGVGLSENKVADLKWIRITQRAPDRIITFHGMPIQVWVKISSNFSRRIRLLVPLNWALVGEIAPQGSHTIYSPLLLIQLLVGHPTKSQSRKHNLPEKWPGVAIQISSEMCHVVDFDRSL